MRFFAFLVIAVFSLAFSSCNRAPVSATPKPQTEAGTKEKVDLNSIEDFGEEFVKRMGARVDLSEEQKAAIRKMSLEFDFSGADEKGRKLMVKQIRERIKREVLTPEQLKGMKR